MALIGMDRDVYFVNEFNKIQKITHQTSVEHGFDELGNAGEKIALIHGELSEGLEFLRKGNGPSDKIPEFLGIEEELADAVIRIMNFAEARKLRLAEAIVAKNQYNHGRPYKHGKAF